jgi:hypothetical protein
LNHPLCLVCAACSGQKDIVLHRFTQLFLAVTLLTAFSSPQARAATLSSSNIPLDSPIYLYLEKLAGMGLVTSDVKGLKPFSRAEASRLVLEAERVSKVHNDATPALGTELIERIREMIPREVSLYGNDSKPQLLDFNPLVSARLRYVYLDGAPRNYNRLVWDPANQSAFGFIGGNLRPQQPAPVLSVGVEGTPLLENNNGTIHPAGNSAELRGAAEGYLSRFATLFVEPQLLVTPTNFNGFLEKGYLKIGGGGLELEVGRDENWFGPGYRGSTVLTNNARNFDQIKLWSPEPLDVYWVKEYLGAVKYAIVAAQFDESGSGVKKRQPYFLGMKLAVKPREWFEIGANFARQLGGPGTGGKSASISEIVFGGGNNDRTNSIAGFDLRFRMPWLRNSEIYAEYSGEDSAGFWPFVESYVAGLYVPCLTDSCRDDFRFEFFWGSVMLYAADTEFPVGYTYHGMTPGHSQGIAAQDYFFRYSHWFGPRNNLAVEYFYTERGQIGLMPGQSPESKHAGRISWTVPVYGDVDARVLYGAEQITNLNLVSGVDRLNQLLVIGLSYRY